MLSFKVPAAVKAEGRSGLGARALGSVALALAALLVACASSEGGAASLPADGGVPAFPVAPLEVQSSDDGALHIEVRTAPTQPPTLGTGAVEITVLDATTGAPRAGLALGVTPFMPSMNHGMSVSPTVVEASPGHYVVQPLSFFMPGPWELLTDFGAASAHATLAVTVP